MMQPEQLNAAIETFRVPRLEELSLIDRLRALRVSLRLPDIDDDRWTFRDSVREWMRRLRFRFRLE